MDDTDSVASCQQAVGRSGVLVHLFLRGADFGFGYRKMPSIHADLRRVYLRKRRFTKALPTTAWTPKDVQELQLLFSSIIAWFRFSWIHKVGLLPAMSQISELEVEVLCLV